MRLRVQSIFLALFALILFGGCADKKEGLTTWNEYRGKIDGYTVSIEETERDGKWMNIVHLHPQGCTGACLEGAITGHSSGHANFAYYRVFRCGEPSPAVGCNSVVSEGIGWKWEPCPADKDRVKPFSDAEIDSAIDWLDIAVKTVYTSETRKDLLAEHLGRQAMQTAN